MNIPTELVAHVGQFLDYSDRKKCVAAAKCFLPVNFEYTYHSQTFDHTNAQQKMDFISNIFKSIKQRKPKCKIVDLCFKSILNLNVDVQAMRDLAEFMSQSFDTVCVSIVNVPESILYQILEGISGWTSVRIDMIHLRYGAPPVSIPHLKTALKGCKPFDLVINTQHIHCCEDIELMSMLKGLRIIHNSDEDHIPITISLKHCTHMASVWLLLGSSNVTIADGIEHITYLNLDDMAWNTQESKLLASFRASPQFKQKSKLKTMSLRENHVGVKLSFAWINPWFEYAQLVPDSCDVWYASHNYNVITPEILKGLRKVHTNTHYAYQDDDTYLLSKVFQRMPVLPDLQTKPYHHLCFASYEPPDELVQLTDTADIHARLSDLNQSLWHWIA